MSVFQFNVDRWLIEIMGFANRPSPKCIEKLGMSERSLNTRFIERLIAEGQNVLEHGDSFLPKDSIKYSFDDIDEARLQYVQFLKFSNFDDPTKETIAKLLQLPASLRKILTYYQDVIAMNDEMQKKEDTPEKSTFADLFQKAHGKPFRGTELHYLSENAERSRVIFAEAVSFVNRLEQVINPESYPLRFTAPTGMDSKP